LGIRSKFKNKFAIGESRKGLKKSAAKKSAAKKIGGKKKFELKIENNETQPKKNRIFLENPVS
jgi:hypothetical protein